MKEEIKERLKEILCDNDGYERIYHPEKIEEDILELFEEILEKVKNLNEKKCLSK
ncbi:MAG: hypothetical protein DDT19_02729 [Syntrophomonadaceae bacterium]|nr:hypothetical protein [Bacillota bacterium]